MIQINLLPGAKKKRSARSSSVDLSSTLSGFTSGLSSRMTDKFLVAAIVSAVLGSAAIGWMWYSQRGEAEALAERLDDALTDSSRFATLLRARSVAVAKRDTLERQVNLIRSLDEDRYVWPHVMDEVSRALPQYTWLTVLTFIGTPQGAVNVAALPPPPAEGDTAAPKRLDTTIPKDPISVRVMGRTVDSHAVPRFMRQLEASPFLSNVAIERSEFANEGGKEVTQFALTMTFERPDTLMLRRRPLVVAR